MLNKLTLGPVRAGDTVIAAVSGGPDSMALLFALYLKGEEWGIRLEAAHFNHQLRGEESDAEERFVRDFCAGYGIPLHLGREQVVPGKKGLEAAAREARYRFFDTLDGWIATAHTADDNAETVLLHLVRGTGLKGLGGITPVSGRRIRPMLNITRREVMDFLREYGVDYRVDSSNETDQFLRNRLRRHVMPLLREENPRIAENLSAMALRLRQDEEALAQAAECDTLPDVQTLRRLPAAVRSRMLERFLKESGVPEPEAEHIALAERLVFSDRPSARGDFPGGVTLCRDYGALTVLEAAPALEKLRLPEQGSVDIPGYRITCGPADRIENSQGVFTVCAEGAIYVRGRQSGDALRLSGGTKTLKKLFVDRKIPARERDRIPVLADGIGVLAVYGIGVNLDRAAKCLPAVRILIEKKEK